MRGRGDYEVILRNDVVEVRETVGETIEQHQGEQRGGLLAWWEDGCLCSMEEDNLRLECISQPGCCDILVLPG